MGTDSERNGLAHLYDGLANQRIEHAVLSERVNNLIDTLEHFQSSTKEEKAKTQEAIKAIKADVDNVKAFHNKAIGYATFASMVSGYVFKLLMG